MTENTGAMHNSELIEGAYTTGVTSDVHRGYNGTSYLFQGDASYEPAPTIEGMSAEDIANFRRYFRLSPDAGHKPITMMDTERGFPEDQMVIMISPSSYRFLRDELDAGVDQPRPEQRKGWYQSHNRQAHFQGRSKKSRSHKTR